MNSCRGVGLPRQSRGELEVPGRPARPRRQDTSIRLRRIGKSDAANHGLDVLALGFGRRPGLARGDVPFKLEVVLRRVARRAANRARPARPGASPRVDPPAVAPAALEAHGHRLDVLGDRNVAARVPIAPPLRRRAGRHDRPEHRRRLLGSSIRRCVVCVHRWGRRARVVGHAVVHPWVKSVRRGRRRVRPVRVPGRASTPSGPSMALLAFSFCQWYPCFSPDPDVTAMPANPNLFRLCFPPRHELSVKYCLPPCTVARLQVTKLAGSPVRLS